MLSLLKTSVSYLCSPRHMAAQDRNVQQQLLLSAALEEGKDDRSNWLQNKYWRNHQERRIEKQKEISKIHNRKSSLQLNFKINPGKHRPVRKSNTQSFSQTTAMSRPGGAPTQKPQCTSRGDYAIIGKT